jgi:hypothetical protein
VQDARVYLADIEGSILSLVHFGDDVLARATDKTNMNDEGRYVPNTDVIPAEGTNVIVRLTPSADESIKTEKQKNSK